LPSRATVLPSPRKLSTGAALAAAAVAAFLPAMWVGFLSDDYILRRILSAIASPVWPFDRNDLGVAHGAGHFYRPLWLLFNDGVQTVFGTSAAALHAGNLVLYAVLTLEVWQLARRFVGAEAAWLAALFFALRATARRSRGSPGTPTWWRRCSRSRRCSPSGRPRRAEAGLPSPCCWRRWRRWPRRRPSCCPPWLCCSAPSRSAR